MNFYLIFQKKDKKIVYLAELKTDSWNKIRLNCFLKEQMLHPLLQTLKKKEFNQQVAHELSNVNK